MFLCIICIRSLRERAERDCCNCEQRILPTMIHASTPYNNPPLPVVFANKRVGEYSRVSRV